MPINTCRQSEGRGSSGGGGDWPGLTLRNHAREALWAPCSGGPGRVDARSQEMLRLGPSGSYCRCKSSVSKMSRSDVVAQACALHLSVWAPVLLKCCASSHLLTAGDIVTVRVTWSLRPPLQCVLAVEESISLHCPILPLKIAGARFRPPVVKWTIFREISFVFPRTKWTSI